MADRVRLRHLETILSLDPDGGEVEPTPEAHAAFEAWVIRTFGADVWRTYNSDTWIITEGF